MTKTAKIVATVGVGLPVLCCLGSALLFNETMRQNSARGDRELATLKSKGLPTDVSQLYPKSELPPERNAATYYRQFTDATNSKPTADLIKAIEKGYGPKASPEARGEAIQAYAKAGAIYALINKATDQAKCEFEIPVTGMVDSFPHFAAMKGAAKLLAFEADLRSKKGDWKGALDRVRRGYRLSAHTGDMFLIAMLVQVANSAIINRAFENVIADHPNDRAFLREARALIVEQDRSLPSIRNAVFGELPMTLNELERVKTLRDLQFSSGSGDEPPEKPSATETLFSGPLRTLLRSELIHAYVFLEPGLPKDSRDWRSADKALKDLGTKYEKDKNPATVLAQILIPTYNQIGGAVGKLQAERRVMRTAVELLIQRADTKRLPGALDAKQPWTIDPFTDRPLGYIPLERGFTVYSLGPDLVDDRGVPRGNDRKTFDIPFTLR